MVEKDSRVIPTLNPAQGGNIVTDLSQRIKLILRLMRDSRVSPLLKLLPVGSLVYLVFPFDIPTPLDDALVIWLGATLFVELCPPEVVEEHRRALQGEAKAPGRGGEVIDAPYWEEKK